jgi:protein SCO1/2
MSKLQKILTTTLWGLVVISMVALIAAWSGARSRHASAATHWGSSHSAVPAFEVPDFSLIDQDGKTVTKADFKNQVWVAAFIFTRCAGTCPMMASKMGQLQKTITDPRIKLVSFTLDPERDTPQVLKEYGAKFGAEPGRWYFLTGQRSKMVELALGLKLPTQVGLGPAEIVHSDRFVLIGKDGRTAGYFDGTNDEQVTRLAVAAGKLASNR